MAHLFSPITIQNLTIPNRLVMPPMVRLAREMSAEVIVADGKITPAVAEHYVSRVRAGVGMIIIEATAVDPGGRVWSNGFNLYADEQIDNLAQLAQGIRSAGGKSCIQLVHGGPQATPELCGGEIVGPSAIRTGAEAPLPRELSIAEIQAIEMRFADAAARAVAAGFDAVEIHGAHGYLLDSFQMKRRNQRMDAYGIDSAGRLRMLLETCQLVRQRIGNKALLFCRLSPFTKRDEGYSLEDLAALIRGLEHSSVDVLHLSTDGAFKGWFGTDKSLGHHVRDLTHLPILIAGGLRQPEDAQRLLTENHADMAAVGTAILRDPLWPTKARQALSAQ